MEIKTLEKPKLTLTSNVEGHSGQFIFFSWEQVLYANTYKVQIKRDSKWKTLKFYSWDEVDQSNPNRYQDLPVYQTAKEMGLKEGQVYSFRVVACRGSVKSRSVSQKICWIDYPYVTCQNNIEKGTFTVKWEKKNVTGYKIEVFGSDGSVQEFDIKETEKNEKIITGLKNEIMYDISISAYKDNEGTKWVSGKVHIPGIISTDIKKLNVEKLIIPEGITSLDEFVYTYIIREKDKVLENVKELYLPSTLTNFRGMWEAREIFPNLQVIHIAEENEKLSYQDGVLYENQDGVKSCILWALPNVASGDIVMPSTVRSVYSEAFEGCDSITSLTFSREFEYVVQDDEGDSFYQRVSKRRLGICKNIKAYYVENGNEKYKAIEGVLYSADGAELCIVPQGYEGKLTIQKGTMRVYAGAFTDCTKMTDVKIPYGLTDLDSFENCDSLIKVVIPASVERGVFFRKCDKLESIKFKWEQPFGKPTSAKFCIEKKCPNLKAVYVPKGTKKAYRKMIRGVARELLKSGNYKPQTKKIEKLDKPKVTIESFGTTFYVSWEQVLYAEGYKVQLKVGDQWKTLKLDRWTRIDTANPNGSGDYLPLYFDAREIGVKEGEMCYFRVVAYRGTLKSISEPQKVYWIDRPKIISAKNTEAGTVVVKWKKKNVTGYKIQVYGSDGSEREFVIKGAGKTRKTITGLVPGIRYYIYISAYKKSGNQEWVSDYSYRVSVMAK